MTTNSLNPKVIAALFIMGISAQSIAEPSSQSITQHGNSFQLKRAPDSSGTTKNVGINQGGTYTLGSGSKLRVKTRMFHTREKDSLIISYLSSRIGQFICPNQFATVAVVKDPNGEWLVGSYDVPGFEPHDGKNLECLDLALDLMDIQDRRVENVGRAAFGGNTISVAVDIDYTDNFADSWTFGTGFCESCLDARLSGSSSMSMRYTKAEFYKAVAHVSQIHDADIKSVFSMAVNELERDLWIPNLDKHYPLDFIIGKMLERKHQMEWAHRHLDSLRQNFMSPEEIGSFLTTEDRDDDRYGYFLNAAIKENNTPLALELLAKGARDSDGYVLATAISKRNTGMVKRLLESGFKDSEGRALAQAVALNDFELVKELIKFGAVDPAGRALAKAAANNNSEMLQFLLAHHARDPEGLALEHAVQRKNVEMVTMLLKHEATDSRNRGLWWAIMNKDTEMVRLLLYKGLNDPNNWILEFAASQGQVDVMRMLLELGAKDPDGRFLVNALSRGHLDAAKCLVENGSKDSSGKALAYAANKGDAELVRMLLEHGSTDPTGKSITQLLLAQPI